jgi:hypothetical protein
MKLVIEKSDGTKITFEGEASEIERIAKEVLPLNPGIQLVPYFIPQYPAPQPHWPSPYITWQYPITVSPYTPNLITDPPFQNTCISDTSNC